MVSVSARNCQCPAPALHLPIVENIYLFPRDRHLQNRDCLCETGTIGNHNVFSLCLYADVLVISFAFTVLLLVNTDVALDREIEGDLILGDMGQGIPFRPGTFDGCIR